MLWLCCVMLVLWLWLWLCVCVCVCVCVLFVVFVVRWSVPLFRVRPPACTAHTASPPPPSRHPRSGGRRTCANCFRRSSTTLPSGASGATPSLTSHSCCRISSAVARFPASIVSRRDTQSLAASDTDGHGSVLKSTLPLRTWRGLRWAGVGLNFEFRGLNLTSFRDW